MNKKLLAVFSILFGISNASLAANATFVNANTMLGGSYKTIAYTTCSMNQNRDPYSYFCNSSKTIDIPDASLQNPRPVATIFYEDYDNSYPKRPIIVQLVSAEEKDSKGNVLAKGQFVEYLHNDKPGKCDMSGNSIAILDNYVIDDKGKSVVTCQAGISY